MWEDVNHDGVQDSVEPGVNGVTTTLYLNGVPVSETHTYVFGGRDGYYTFTNLISGTYSVTFAAPVAYEFTLADNTGDTSDSDAASVVRGPSSIVGTTGDYMLSAGGDIPTVDAGIWRPANLGDYVWEDLNHDGVQDSVEPGVDGVVVTLLDNAGHIISTVATYQGGPLNSHGYYTFTNLISNTYVLSFTIPNGYQATLSNHGNTDADDSDGALVGGLAAGRIQPDD